MWGGYPNLEDDVNVWAYDYNSNTWEEFENVDGPSTHFERFGMIYRPVDDRIYLYSGFQEGFEDRPEMMNEPETWRYDLNTNTWEKLNTPDNPGPRIWYSMVYDEAVDKILMYGGEQTAKYDVNLTNAVWIFDFDSLNWVDVSNDHYSCPD